MLYIFLTGILAISIVIASFEKHLYISRKTHLEKINAIQKLLKSSKQQQVQLQRKVDATEILTKGKNKDLSELIMMICFYPWTVLNKFTDKT